MIPAVELASGRPTLPSSHAPRLGGTTAILAMYVALSLLSLLPFVVVEHPPVLDYPNHVARLFLACNAGDPVIAGMYKYQLGIIPNLAVDLINLPLCRLMAPAAVVKTLTVASLLLIYVSGWIIQRKLFGHPTAFLLLLPAIALNLVTTMGYVNFLAGIAIAIFLIGIAIGREHDFKALLLLCNVGGLVLFFCHIFSLAFALVFFFGLMLGRVALNIRGVAEASLRTAALFALPLVLTAFVPGEGQGLSIDYSGKVRMLVALFMTQHFAISIFSLVLLASFYLLFRKRLVKVHPLLRIPLIILGIYVAVVPSRIQDAVDVDSRTLVAIAYLFFLAIHPAHHESKITAALAAVSAGVAAVQIWATLAVWQPFSREVAEFRQSLNILPSSASVLSVAERDGDGGSAQPLAYTHLTSYATIDRQVFNPIEFTGVGMQPLSVTPRYARLDTPGAFPFKPETAIELKSPSADLERRAYEKNAEFALRWPERFDYVIYYHFGRRQNFDPAVLTEIRRGSFFSILKVKKSGQLEQVRR